MLQAKTVSERPPLGFSCYYTNNRSGEQFAPEHAMSYTVSGTSLMSDGEHEYRFTAGDTCFCRRNQLVKFTKLPEPEGVYQSVSVYFDQQTLQHFALEYSYKSAKHVAGNAFTPLHKDALLDSFNQSLLLYQDIDLEKNRGLIALKQKEAILLLLRLKPGLKNILFDFNEPGKIDLEAFMNKNYLFNVELGRFAYLTGRSLATFKRDFQKIYSTSPARWLLQKRLQDAYYLIKEKGVAPSSIYLDLGFEDLSHFSYAFKKMYGVAPSRV